MGPKFSQMRQFEKRETALGTSPRVDKIIPRRACSISSLYGAENLCLQPQQKKSRIQNGLNTESRRPPWSTVLPISPSSDKISNAAHQELSKTNCHKCWVGTTTPSKCRYYRRLYSPKIGILTLVFNTKNVVITIEHSLPCNVPSIRTTINTIHSKGHALHREIKLL